jgi:hypothetical protein
VEVTGDPVADLAEPRVLRGAAWGDLDRDGDPDLVVTANGGPAVVFENRSGAGDADRGNWLRLDLRGHRSERDGIGARIELTTGDEVQRWLVRTGGSYLSQSQVDPLFGLGAATKADKIVVRWPSGAEQTFEDVAANRVFEVEEPAAAETTETSAE